MIGIGAVVAFLGLCVLPASLGENGDHALFGVGAGIFSLGALTIAGGIYLKAIALQPKSNGKSTEELASPGHPIRGGCDRCQLELPVIQCKVHQQHLCGTCLAEHYDFRSCVYAPSTRRTPTTAKFKAARAGK
jgi:hypothetical protein